MLVCLFLKADFTSFADRHKPIYVIQAWCRWKASSHSAITLTLPSHGQYWSPAISGYASNFQHSLQAPWWSIGRKKEDKQANKQKAKQKIQTKIMNGEWTEPGVSLGGPIFCFPSQSAHRFSVSPQYSWLRWSLFTGYGWQFNFSRIWRPVSVFLSSSPTLASFKHSGAFYFFCPRTASSQKAFIPVRQERDDSAFMSLIPANKTQTTKQYVYTIDWSRRRGSLTSSFWLKGNVVLRKKIV